MGAAQSDLGLGHEDLEHKVLDPETGRTHVEVPGTNFVLEYDDAMLREIADMGRKRTAPEATWCCAEYPADEYPALCEFLGIDMADACEARGPKWSALRDGFRNLLPERYRNVRFSEAAAALPYGPAKLERCRAEIAEAEAFLVGVPDSAFDERHAYSLPRYVRAAYVQHNKLPESMAMYGGEGITPDATWDEEYGHECVSWMVSRAIHNAKEAELKRQKGLVEELVGPAGVDAYVTGTSPVFEKVCFEGEPHYTSSALGQSEVTVDVVERARRKRLDAEAELATMHESVGRLARRDTIDETMRAARRLHANASAAAAIVGQAAADAALPELDSVADAGVAAAVARVAARESVDFGRLLRELGRNSDRALLLLDPDSPESDDRARALKALAAAASA